MYVTWLYYTCNWTRPQTGLLQHRHCEEGYWPWRQTLYDAWVAPACMATWCLFNVSIHEWHERSLMVHCSLSQKPVLRPEQHGINGAFMSTHNCMAHPSCDLLHGLKWGPQPLRCPCNVTQNLMLLSKCFLLQLTEECITNFLWNICIPAMWWLKSKPICWMLCMPTAF